MSPLTLLSPLFRAIYQDERVSLSIYLLFIYPGRMLLCFVEYGDILKRNVIEYVCSIC